MSDGLIAIKAEALELPLFPSGLCAGFPSPADDFAENTLDLATLLVRNRPATFLFRVDGESMIDHGIFHNDIVVVDRSLQPVDGRIVVAIVNGERSLKVLRQSQGRMWLEFGNRRFPPHTLPEIADVQIWGVVTWALRRLLPVPLP